MSDINLLESTLEMKLSKKSFQHSQRTRDVARDLAVVHGEDPERVEVAALLHDYARDFSASELISKSKEYGHEINWVEKRSPYLLHAPLGATLVEKDFGIEDISVLGAIRKHTYGDVEMGALEMIVYLADFIEPGRHGKDLEILRETAQTDLLKAFKMAYEEQIRELIVRGAYLHPKTVEVWNRLIDSELEYGRS